jgi:hypothetical protein
MLSGDFLPLYEAVLVTPLDRHARRVDWKHERDNPRARDLRDGCVGSLTCDASFDSEGSAWFRDADPDKDAIGNVKQSRTNIWQNSLVFAQATEFGP